MTTSLIPDAGKRAAGTAAAELVEPGMQLGLGTGSTVRWFLEGIAARGLDVAGVPTSQGTADRCLELGIRLLDPLHAPRLDLAVDGADEFDTDLTATKGGGGALVREKVVATMAERFVVIATPDKAVPRLGDTFPLPVEVVPFAVGPVSRAIQERGAVVSLRLGSDGEPYRTDNGNAVLDARFPGGIEDPAVTDVMLATTPGVVTSGLFVDLVDLVILGDPHGRVEHRSRPAADASVASVLNAG